MVGNAVTDYWKKNALKHIIPDRDSEYPEGKTTIIATVDECRGTVLEFGCGRGRLAPFFNRNQYLGVDISQHAIDAARTANPRHEFRSIMPFDDLPDTDTILAYTVLHHIQDKHMPEIADIFRKAPRIVITEIMEPSLATNSMPPCLNRSPNTYQQLFQTHILDRIQHFPTPAYPGHDMTVLTLCRL